MPQDRRGEHVRLYDGVLRVRCAVCEWPALGGRSAGVSVPIRIMLLTAGEALADIVPAGGRSKLSSVPAALVRIRDALRCLEKLGNPADTASQLKQFTRGR